MSVKTLGICGSGQLSMMLCQAAKRHKIKTIVLTDDKDGPAKKYCDEFFYCNLNNKSKIEEFTNKIDVATLEFENFDFSILEQIEKIKSFFPNPKINKIVQDRILEKEFFRLLKIPVTNYALIKKKEDIKKNSSLLPGILKSTKGGYDGHFSYRINSISEIDSLNIDFSRIHILEKKVNFIKEISIIATRYQSGQISFFLPFENIHKDQILNETKSPANIEDRTAKIAIEYSRKLLLKHNYIGTMAIEYFLDQDDNLLANETASRVHNSGHITINNYTSSQFDQHIRAVCNLTFEEPKLINKGKMINILGEEILKFRKKKFSNNEHFFDYGKKIIRPKRKMGHLNIIEL